MINKMVVLSSLLNIIDNESNTGIQIGSYKMKLIIAEKPDQGLALVSQFKYRRKDGYFRVRSK